MCNNRVAGRAGTVGNVSGTDIGRELPSLLSSQLIMSVVHGTDAIFFCRGCSVETG